MRWIVSTTVKMGDRHGWISYDRYLAIHDACMDDFREHWIVEDNLEWIPEEEDFRLKGTIRCLNGLLLHVNKVLETNDRHQVRTKEYSYQAEWEGPPRRPIFRYDNAHIFETLNHPDEYHKHVWNPTTARSSNRSGSVGTPGQRSRTSSMSFATGTRNTALSWCRTSRQSRSQTSRQTKSLRRFPLNSSHTCPP